MRRALKLTAVVGLAAFAAMQLMRPHRSNPPEEPARTLGAQAQVPPSTLELLQRACADCHSFRTEWPWYSHVAPVSWWLAAHVQEARQHMNFSEWPDSGDPTGRIDAVYMLREICHQVRKRKMPLPSFRLMHPEARLSGEEVQSLCDWTQQEMRRLSGG